VKSFLLLRGYLFGQDCTGTCGLPVLRLWVRPET